MSTFIFLARLELPGMFVEFCMSFGYAEKKQCTPKGLLSVLQDQFASMLAKYLLCDIIIRIQEHTLVPL